MTGSIRYATEPMLLWDGRCQRWYRRRHSWRHRSDGGFDATRYRVVPLPEVTARGFVTSHHYSGSWPAARLRYGLVERSELVGALVLGVPMRAAVLTTAFPGLDAYRQSLELARLVLLDRVPANAESWFTTKALALAAAEGVRGVVMFSDPLPRTVTGVVTMPGHVGTVYQALGCRYTGRGTPRTLTILPDGSVLSDRAAQKVRAGERGAGGVVRRLVGLGASAPTGTADAGWLAAALADIAAKRVRHRGNHRYVLAIGDRGVRRRTAIGLEPVPVAAARRPSGGLVMAARLSPEQRARREVVMSRVALGLLAALRRRRVRRRLAAIRGRWR